MSCFLVMYFIHSNFLLFLSIIIIIIIIIISFMQRIYTHIPETNYVPRKYSVAAILLFPFMVFLLLLLLLLLIIIIIIIIITK